MQQKEALPPLEKYETQKQNQTELRETNEPRDPTPTDQILLER